VAARLVELVRHGFLHRDMARPATLPFGHQDRQSGLRSLHVPLGIRNDGQYPGIHAPTRYAAPIWMTFKQAHELGAHVRKGEHGSLVVYANTITRTDTDAETGEESEQEIPFMKGYSVFNVEQIDGLPAHFTAPAETVIDPVERIAHVEAFFANTGAEIRHGGNRAFYTVTGDYVQMPPFECFRDRESYYAILADELTHWTKHCSRLGRDFGRKRFGDEGYAMEELVAELNAAFLSADLGLTPSPREEHAAYIASWLKELKKRQARDLHRSRVRATRRRLFARPATDAGSTRGLTHARPATAGRVPDSVRPFRDNEIVYPAIDQGEYHGMTFASVMIP
jgi:antirestriction protein ArdC